MVATRQRRGSQHDIAAAVGLQIPWPPGLAAEEEYGEGDTYREEVDRSRIMADAFEAIVSVATRAPSIHNTQPWLFRRRGAAIELIADARRRLAHVDPDGRELLISCGAALFGLRLAIRHMGWRPLVQLLPPDGQPCLIARVSLAAPSPVRPGEEALLRAMQRRHTHRGAPTGRPIPAGLLPALQREAESERATLVFIHEQHRYEALAKLVSAAERGERQRPAFVQELRGWTHPPDSASRDGLTGRDFPPRYVGRDGALVQRDYDLGRGWGAIMPFVEPPGATGLLVTGRDTPAEWLEAGQALHRLLLRAAHDWVFASLHTQPLELVSLRAALRDRLRIRGAPQMVLQLSPASTSRLTARRPTDHVMLA